MANNNLAHSKISPTAKLLAYWRQNADLPFSQEIAEFSEANKTVHEMFEQQGKSLSLNDIFISYAELRYKSIQQAIKNLKIKQVLEFASGFSLRGLAMSSDPSLTYVETDLPGLMKEKETLVKRVKARHKISSRQNLFYHTVNILKMSEIELALKNLDPKEPLIIVHEGLFQYLSKSEKRIAAQNIYTVLKRFGGVWITPDFDTSAEAKQQLSFSKDIREMIEVIGKATNRSMEDNRFKNETEVYSFLDDLGFSIKKKPQWNSALQLSDPNKRQNHKDYVTLLKNLYLWEMKIK